MRPAFVFSCYLAGGLIGFMVIFELCRWNIYPALMWMLMAAVYLTAMMVLIDHIDAKGGFDG